MPSWWQSLTFKNETSMAAMSLQQSLKRVEIFGWNCPQYAYDCTKVNVGLWLKSVRRDGFLYLLYVYIGVYADN
jgi:hypothetical protein